MTGFRHGLIGNDRFRTACRDQPEKENALVRPILAAILSLALAFPAVTTPARADSRDVARIVGGLAALYILKEAIERNRERDQERDRGRAVTVTRGNNGYGHELPRRHGRPGFQDTRILPDQCYDTVRTNRGTAAGYRARCMQNAVARPGQLPPQCIVQVRTDRGPRNLYEARCLRSQGWTSRAARR